MYFLTYHSNIGTFRYGILRQIIRNVTLKGMIIMCSNYLFPSKRNLMLLGVDTSQFDLELKDHVFPSYHAPIILNGSEHLELDIAKFGLLPSWAKENTKLSKTSHIQ